MHWKENKFMPTFYLQKYETTETKIYFCNQRKLKISINQKCTTNSYLNKTIETCSYILKKIMNINQGQSKK